MALQVWLPLNGNLNNQGLTNVTVTNNGATVDNNGKIGKCYSFNGSSNYIQITMPSTMTTILNTTVTAWVKSTGSVVALGGISNDGDYRNAMVTLYTSGWQFAGGTGYKYISGGSIANSGVWHHVACTVTDTTVTTYLDGNQVATNTLSALGITVTDITSANFIEIGCDHPGGNEFLTGCVNDFRIYDHALAPKEIEILSRGLVAHYPLSDSAIESTTNLVSSLTAGTRTSLTDNNMSIVTKGTSGDTYFYLNLSEPIENDVTYTLSLDASGIPSGKHWRFGFDNNLNFLFDIYNGHNTYTFTANSSLITSRRSRPLIDDNNNDCDYAVTTFSHIQLEKKDHATLYAGLGGTRSGDTTVYDTSGYQYNGTVNGTITVSDDTARYSMCTSFNGTDNSIRIPLDTFFPNATTFTINLWFKKSELGSKGYETLIGGVSGFEMDTRSGTAETLSLYMASTRGGAVYSPFDFNKWYMVTMVCDGTNELYYVNGALVKTITKKGMPSGGYWIGAWNASTGQNYKGLMSDVRIYATALSAAQVAELYNTAVSVANNGTLMGYELVEV